jgi:hypothetical protein
MPAPTQFGTEFFLRAAIFAERSTTLLSGDLDVCAVRALD